MLGHRPAMKPLTIVSSVKPYSVLDSDQESNVKEETSTEASLGGDGTSTVNEVCI